MSAAQSRLTPAMDQPSKRDQAVDLARQGFRVFPLVERGKRPMFEGWQESASADPDRVHRAWSEALSGDPLDYNIGIATGHGLFVLDVDDKNGKHGSATLEGLELLNDYLPQTLKVSTPTGGAHYYLTASAENWVSNSVGKLGEGLDIKGDGGYVVGPGSITEYGAYQCVSGARIAAAPGWLTDQVAGSRPTKIVGIPSGCIELDLPEAVERARHYLVEYADPAIENDGGDAATYRTAAAVLEYGLSVSMALEIMLEHWNDRCEPPWEDEQLQVKVENAARYMQSIPGSRSADAEFDVVELELETPAAAKLDDEWPTPTPVSTSDPARIPRREWLMEGLLVRFFVTGLIAPGGMGKTNLVAAISHALVSGRSDITGFEVPKRAAVWYWNQEDDPDEIQRRFAASRQLHRIDQDQLRIGGNIALFTDSGVERPLMLAKRAPGGVLKAAAEVERVIEQIQRNGIDVFIIDPLVEFHEADENNNPEMQRVWRTAREIAVRGSCAVMIVAHTRKPPGASAEGHQGDINSLRGAGSQAGVMRIGVTLSGMTEKEATALRVPVEDRRWFTKLEGGKHNLTPRGAAAIWFKSVGVTIANGEEIGAIKPANFAVADLARPVLGPLEETLLAAFWTVARRNGPFETTVTTPEWMAEAEIAWANSGSAASNPKESIRKCRQALEVKGAVKKGQRNQWVALVPEVAEVTEVNGVGRAEVGSPPIGGTSTASAAGSSIAMVVEEARG